MKLEVGSQVFSGFISAHVRSSMDSLFDQFKFVSTSRIVSDKLIKLGNDCRVIAPDDSTLLDGYIYGLTVPIGGDVIITGSDKAQDLMSSNVSGTGEFKNLTAKQIIQSICLPFGITVSGTADASVDVFRYNINERASDVILELLGRYGLLANSDGSGNLVLTTATTTDRATLQLVEGNNIIDGAVMLSENRNSEFTLHGQNRTGSVSSSVDGLSARHRPSTAIFTGNVTSGQVTTGAAWGAKMAQPEMYSVRVSGIYNVRPNTLIPIESNTLGVSGDLLIRAVTWSLERGGHTTTFELVNPAVYGGENTDCGWLA